jgi:Ca2+-binding RTX toxin-like protein
MTTTRTTALGAALGLGLALVAVPAATADPGSCLGRAVTVSGATGTDGDDVMVVGPGQKSVSSGAGDDLVCIRLTEVDPVKRYLFLDTGAGTDAVHNETTASARSVTVFLGAGADTFVGNDSREFVSAGADSFGGTGDTERDVIDTAGGADAVQTGSVAAGSANPDVISTGEGDDGVTWAGEQLGGTVDLGAGGNRLVLKSGWAGDDVDIDATAGVVAVAARPVLRWTGDVTSYSLEYTHLRTSFTGADLHEYLTFWPSQRDQEGPPSSVSDPGLRLDADMRGGDDRIEMLDAAGGSRVGGAGTDRLGMPRCRVADVRLGTGYECQDESRARTPYSGALDAWERLSVPGWRLRVTGTAGPDVITVTGNRVRLDGRGGDDVLSVPGSAGSWPSAPPAVVRGGAGDDLVRGGYLRDRLLGGPGNDRIYGNGYPDVIKGGPGRDRLWGGKRADTLLGGGGRDRADGGPARDRCSAEVRLACERR